MSVNINVLNEIHIENHKELKETTLECYSCDNTCTKKDTLRIHKGMKNKAK